MECKKPNSTSACARCRVPYCSKVGLGSALAHPQGRADLSNQECQTKSWKEGHKRECEIVQRLRDWNSDSRLNQRQEDSEEEVETDYDDEEDERVTDQEEDESVNESVDSNDIA